jgi:calcineurin-like phosphoesterase family protein
VELEYGALARKIMIIDCIADLHGNYPILDGGDLLILAGDVLGDDTEYGFYKLMDWLDEQPYLEKIFIAGNHDNFLQDHDPRKWYERRNAIYLCDSSTIVGKFKVYGTPWVKSFDGMNPHCKAFTLDTEEQLAEKWSLIPEDVDILITHSPPLTILDRNIDGLQVGSAGLLAQHITNFKPIIPKLWVWGHIHEAYGQHGPRFWNNTKYVNASLVNFNYKPVNKPVRIVL